MTGWENVAIIRREVKRTADRNVFDSAAEIVEEVHTYFRFFDCYRYWLIRHDACHACSCMLVMHCLIYCSQYSVMILTLQVLLDRVAPGQLRLLPTLPRPRHLAAQANHHRRKRRPRHPIDLNLVMDPITTCPLASFNGTWSWRRRVTSFSPQLPCCHCCNGPGPGKYWSLSGGFTPCRHLMPSSGREHKLYIIWMDNGADITFAMLGDFA